MVGVRTLCRETVLTRMGECTGAEWCINKLEWGLQTKAQWYKYGVDCDIELIDKTLMLTRSNPKQRVCKNNKNNTSFE